MGPPRPRAFASMPGSYYCSSVCATTPCTLLGWGRGQARLSPESSMSAASSLTLTGGRPR